MVDLFLLCLILPLGFNAGPIAMSTMRLLLMLALIPLMVQILTGKHGCTRIPDICFPLFVGWAGVAVTVNNPDQMVQHIGSTGVEFLGGYVVGRACIRSPAAFIKLCKRLVTIVLLSIPFVLIETLTTRPLLLEVLDALPGLSSVANTGKDTRLGLDRVQFVFPHPIHFGVFCSIAFAMSIGLPGASGPGKVIRSSLIAASGFLALSSGALMAMAAQFGLLAWNWMLRDNKAKWWILMGLCVLAYILVDIGSDREPIHVFFSYATFNAHTGYWRLIILEWGLYNIGNNPIFGLGLNDWERPVYMYSGSVDNFWLVNGMRYGIPGFALLAAGYFLPLIRVALRDLSAAPAVASLRLAWVFTFVGTTLVLTTVHVWSSTYAFVFFAFGAGLWILDFEPDTTQAEAPQDDKAARRAAPRFSRDFETKDGPAAQTPAPASPPPPASTDATFTRFADGNFTGDDPMSRN